MMQPFDGFVYARGQAKIVAIDNDLSPVTIAVHVTNGMGL
jgi:hypothetical protein